MDYIESLKRINKQTKYLLEKEKLLDDKEEDLLYSLYVAENSNKVVNYNGTISTIDDLTRITRKPENATMLIINGLISKNLLKKDKFYYLMNPEIMWLGDTQGDEYKTSLKYFKTPYFACCYSQLDCFDPDNCFNCEIGGERRRIIDDNGNKLSIVKPPDMDEVKKRAKEE